MIKPFVMAMIGILSVRRKLNGEVCCWNWVCWRRAFVAAVPDYYIIALGVIWQLRERRRSNFVYPHCGCRAVILLVWFSVGDGLILERSGLGLRDGAHRCCLHLLLHFLKKVFIMRSLFLSVNLKNIPCLLFLQSKTQLPFHSSSVRFPLHFTLKWPMVAA